MPRGYPYALPPGTPRTWSPRAVAVAQGCQIPAPASHHYMRLQSVARILPDGRPLQLCRWVRWSPEYPKAGRLRFTEWPDLEWEILEIYWNRRWEGYSSGKAQPLVLAQLA